LWITGGDLILVQREMGHLYIATTKNYLHNVGGNTDPAQAFSYE